MRYTICHTTRFSYSVPITESVTELRLQPRTDANQRCLSFSVTTTPAARIFAYLDGLGNTVQYFDIPAPHEQLEIVSQALVEVEPPAWSLGSGAETLGSREERTRALLARAEEQLPAAAWDRLLGEEVRGQHFDDLLPSRFVEWTPALRAFAAELSLPRDASPLELAWAIATGVYEGLEYDTEATEVDSPIDEALELRRGVCQDYAHIMLALCRLHGLPARYVSGYLFHRVEAPDRSGADASHAWVEVWLPSLGWVGFDPTNKLLAATRHIRVAVGRDYADVPPVRGVFQGRAASALSVGVSVALALPEARDAVAPIVAWPPINQGELARLSSLGVQQSQQQQQ